MKSLIKRNKHYETFFFQVANFGDIYNFLNNRSRFTF